MRALQKDPSRRFRSAEEMRNVVRALRARRSVPQNIALSEVMRELTSDTIHTRRRDSMTSVSTAEPHRDRARVAGAARSDIRRRAGGDVTIEAGAGQTLCRARSPPASRTRTGHPALLDLPRRGAQRIGEPLAARFGGAEARATLRIRRRRL